MKSFTSLYTYKDSVAVFVSDVIKLFNVHFSSEVDVPFCQDKWLIMKLYSTSEMRDAFMKNSCVLPDDEFIIQIDDKQH